MSTAALEVSTPDAVSVDIKGDEALVNEELIHQAEEIQLQDPFEPKLRTTFAIAKVIGVNWIFLILGAFFSGAQGVIPLVFFYTLGDSFGNVATAGPSEIADVTSQMALKVVWIAIAGGAAGFLAAICWGVGSQLIGRSIRKAYFKKVTEQEIGFFDIKKAGALIHTVTDDAAKATDVYTAQVQPLCQNIIQAIVGFGLSMSASWSMTLIQLCGLPLIILLQMLIRPLFAHFAGKISKLTGDSLSTANEVITSMRTVRSMAGEEKEVQRYKNQLDKITFTGLLAGMTRGTSILIMSFLILGGIAFSFWWGGVQIQNGNMSIAEFIKVFGLGMMCIMGLLMAIVAIPEVVKAQTATMHLLKVILREPQIRFRGGEQVNEIRGHLSFKNVTFRYPSRPKVAVLKDFNLEILPGTSCALVGQSGSGKSTIVGLLEKWYEPEEGVVELDGVDITKLDSLWLHRYLGIVSQEPTLFATSIRRNITYAVDTINGHIKSAAKKHNSKITEEEIQQLLLPVTDDLMINAAKAANCHDFILKLPNQYDTVIGERGVSLSGGQKQRIAIARAVLQDPKILLLDEATSALDTKSEALVQDALEKLMKGRTSVVIAHRLTTIQDCDNIVVMRQGVVVEMGRHDNMIQNPEGAYYKLAAKQMKLGRSESSDTLSQSNDDTASSGDDESTGTPLVSVDDGTAAAVEDVINPTVASSENSARLSMEKEITNKVQEENNKKKKKGRKNKKGLEQFTNEEDIKDMREPKVRNPLLIFKLLGGEIILLSIGAFGAFLAGSSPIFNYLFFGNVVSAATPARNPDGTFIPNPPGFSISDAISTQASYVAIVAGLNAIAQMLNWAFTMYAFERIAARIKRIYFSSLIDQEMGFFDIKKSGKLLSTIGEDIATAADGLTLKFSMFTNHMGMFIVGIILALIASWQTALIMLAAGIPTIGSIIFFSGIVINAFNKKQMHVSASSMATANEVIGSIRTVRSMAGEEREQNRFNNDLDKIAVYGAWKSLATAVMMGGMQFCIWSVAALAFWYGGTLIANGTLAAGSLLQVFGNMLFSVMGASMALGEVQHFFRALLSVHEVQLVTERVPAIAPRGGMTPERVVGNIEFKNVTFEYPSRPNLPVMKNFSLDIKVGQHIALVGESGCGKSSIISLIERFYDPIDGEIFLDGNNMRDIDVRWLHKNIAIVTQEPTLFATTLRKNITYAVGDENVTMDRVIECAKAANCHDFIMNLPNQYDTMVGERGVSMSGGQKQRIAIARAMIQNASVLLLDEATSALDTEAEALVQGALDKLMVGKTTIVIAHRLSTVKDCDVIVAMRQGEIVEMGTHDQLVQKKGMYFKLAQKQMEFGSGSKQQNVVMTEDD